MMTDPSQLQLASPSSRRCSCTQNDLIEDWPRRYSSSSSMEAEQDDETELKLNTKPKPKLHPQVCFSETSILIVYKEYDDDAYTKAYSEADYDAFQHSTRLHARRVKDLIKRSPQESTKESVKFLLENNVISTEDFLGIELLVLGTGGLLRRARHLHAQKVLRQQHEQRQQQLEDPTESLAKVSEESSFKSTYIARVRAQWMLHNDKCSKP
ncbi:hypothetical protein ACHAXM_005624 [Skeletonema potamos]|jgi:hypothetical protein